VMRCTSIKIHGLQANGTGNSCATMPRNAAQRLLL
jgi:hypothetical protein